VLLSRGRLVAEGDVRQIRDLIDEHPHQIVLHADDCRKLAARLLSWDDVEGVRVLTGEKGVMIETRSPDVFYARLPALYLDEGLTIQAVYSDDDSLEAVFKYLVRK
jgi:ABC-2 type transport system ATP-binding protein